MAGKSPAILSTLDMAAKKKKAELNISSQDALEGALASFQATLAELVMTKSKTPLMFKTLDQVRTKFLDIDNLYMENLWGCRGLPEHTIGEIIGTEGTGKTTLAFWLAGRGLRNGMPVLYIETEGKPMLVERAMRNFSSDLATATRLSKLVTYFECCELKQSVEVIEEWARVLREVAQYPRNLPAMVIIDTWGKMMSTAEAAGYFTEIPEYATPEAKRKYKPVGEASNLGHSSFAHDWVRRLPWFLKNRNVIMILVQHQNVKIDMGPGGPSVAAGQLFNKTKIGGKAFDQLAAWQLIMGKGAQWKTSDGQLLGYDVVSRMDKNSYGAGGRRAGWRLQNEMLQDTETTLAPALLFEHDAARWLLDTKLVGASYAQGRYTCAAADVSAATPQEFWNAVVGDAARRNALGKALRIVGYEDTVDNILAEV